MHYTRRLSWRSFGSWSGLYWGASLGAGVLISLGMPANALPGQTVDEAISWIQAHPTLQPAQGETLLVRKSDTPAHRFTFAASTIAAGRVGSNQAVAARGNQIRVEQLSFFDRINGVSFDRLQQALYVIYGAEIYQDYQQASVVYQYPGLESLEGRENLEESTESEPSPASSSTPTTDFIQGEIRRGDRYGYWLETAPTAHGTAYNGQISIFLIEDLEQLQLELQGR